MSRRVSDAVAIAGLALAIIGLAAALGGYHVTWVSYLLLAIGIVVFSLSVRLFVLSPAAREGVPEASPRVDTAAIVVKNSSFVDVSGNVAEDRPVLRADNVHGLRAHYNLSLKAPVGSDAMRLSLLDIVVLWLAAKETSHP